MTAVIGGDEEVPAQSPIQQLVQTCRIIDVIYYEVAARRRPIPNASAEEVEVAPSAEAGEGDEGADQAQELHAEVMVAVNAGRIEVRGRLELEMPSAVALVDAGVSFTFDESLEMTDSLRGEFARRVGFMALYPYLRETLHQAVAKLRLDPPMLGLITPDQLDFIGTTESDPRYRTVFV